jgi:hypothetical protein
MFKTLTEMLIPTSSSLTGSNRSLVQLGTTEVYETSYYPHEDYFRVNYNRNKDQTFAWLVPLLASNR